MMNEEEQGLPPEVDEGTPVIWPTDPEETSDSEKTQEGDNEGFLNIGESKEDDSKTFSYWFGGEVSTDHDNVMPETEELQEKQDQKPSTSRRRRHESDSQDSDPDWTQENDGIILPKKRSKVQRKPEIQNSSETAGVLQSSSSDSSKQFTRFRFSWTGDFRWLHYDAKFRLMYCRICQQAGKTGEFVQGCGNFSKLALRVHDVSKEHIAAECEVQSMTADGYDNNEMAPDATPNIDDEDDDIDTQNTLYSETALLAALRTAYYAAQHCGDRTPAHVYNSVMALQDSCNVSGAKELRLGKQPEKTSVVYVDDDPSSEERQDPEYAFGDDESLAEMHDVLARILQEDLYSKISMSDFISVVIQERPDADLQPLQMQLIIHARYTHKGKVSVGFLATIMVSEDKPEETVSEVMRVLQECELPKEKVVAIQIQCPRKNGKLVTTSDVHHWQIAKGFVDVGMIVLVSAQKHPPWNTCLALAAQQLEEGTKYQHLLGRLVIYLQSISTKLEAIESLKELVNDPICQWDGLQMPAWMMVQKAAKVVCSMWPTIIEVLQTEASDAQAQQLLDELQKYQFLSFVHLLLDILPIMRDLEIQLNYKTPNDACEHIRNALSKLVLTEHVGENERRFSQGLDLEKRTFCNQHIYFSEQQQDRAKQMRLDFLQNTSKEIQARCAVLERASLRETFRVLNPKVLASLKESGLGEFGRKELQALTAAFLDSTSDKDFFPEYQEMKMLLFTHFKTESFKTVSEKISSCKNQQASGTSGGAERCPNVMKLLRGAVTIPGVCMKADQEVGKMLKQSQDFMEKYGTEATTLSRMMIVNHGVKLNTFDFIAALQEWNSV